MSKKFNKKELKKMNKSISGGAVAKPVLRKVKHNCSVMVITNAKSSKHVISITRSTAKETTK